MTGPADRQRLAVDQRVSRGFSPWRNRSTKARISIAVSTRRRRHMVEGLGNRPGRRLAVTGRVAGPLHRPLVQGRPEEDQDDDVGLEADVDEA